MPINAFEGFPSITCDQINFFCKKKSGFLINRSHKTESAIDEFDKSNNGVFLPFFLYLINCGTC